MTISGSSVIIVNDGQYRWYADRETFLATLVAQCWTQQGDRWVEPESDDEAGPDSPYARLCDTVQPLDQDRIDETEGGYFHVRPDFGIGVWQLS